MNPRLLGLGTGIGKTDSLSIPSLLNFPPTLPHHLTLLGESTRLRFLWLPTSYLLCTWQCIPKLQSQFAPPTSSPTVSIISFSISEFLFVPWKYVHQYHFPRFHIHTIFYTKRNSLPLFTESKARWTQRGRWLARTCSGVALQFWLHWSQILTLEQSLLGH